MTERFLDADVRHSLFLVDHSLEAETEAAYFERKEREIRAGAKTWSVRNFDTDGRAVDLWYERQPLAMVETATDDSRVYVLGEDNQLTFLVSRNTLKEAVEVAEWWWGLDN